MMRSAAVIAALAIFAADAAAQQWGTVTGQIVWKGEKLPDRKKIDLVKNPQCAAQKPPLQDDILVDPKSKGIKDVLVWLAPEGNGKLAIHPDLQNVPNKEVVIDQPCCLFEPRVTAMRRGQVLVVKNSAGFAHNVHLSPPIGGINAESNELLQPKGEKRFDKAKLLRAEQFPLRLSCDIHSFMAGRIGVFDHPYFAITGTDGTFEIKQAPANGKVRLFIQHNVGWLHEPHESDKEKKIGGRYGQPIAVPEAGTLNLGKIELKPEQLKN